MKNGNSAEKGKRAWRHIVKRFRDKGAWNAKWQFGYNVSTAKERYKPFKDFYPGDDVVDSIAISVYNRRWSTGWQSFSTRFREPYDKIKSFTDKPIAVGEVSTTQHGGDKSDWIRDAWNSIAYDFVRVQEVDFFLKPTSGQDWDLDTQSQEDAYTNAVRKARDVTGNSHDAPILRVNTVPPRPVLLQLLPNPELEAEHLKAEIARRESMEGIE